MGQVLHGSATTTEAIRRAIQNSEESLRVLAKRHGINQKTVAKWRKRTSAADRPSDRTWGNAARSAPADDPMAPPHPSQKGTVPAVSANSSSHHEDRERRAVSASTGRLVAMPKSTR